MKFDNTNKRGKIDRAGLVTIYERMFGAKCDQLNAPEIEAQIKRFGRCECSKTCKMPLAGKCDFDHKYPNSVSTKGDTIDWRALLPSHHKVKTNKHDVPHISKLKRTAKKYNPEYIEEEDETEFKPQWAKRKMQSKNSPRYDNTKVID